MNALRIILLSCVAGPCKGIYFSKHPSTVMLFAKLKYFHKEFYSDNAQIYDFCFEKLHLFAGEHAPEPLQDSCAPLAR